MADSLDFERTVDRSGEKERQRAGLEAGSHFGKYRIIGLLGRGGMGQVYEVEHLELQTKYALKLISEELVGQPGFLERFRREAQVMARLEHPGIVKVDEFGEDEGHYWLRMELLEGLEKEGKGEGCLKKRERNMDTKIIDEHLKWVRSLESEYRYVEQGPEEFDGFFETAGMTTGVALGITIGSVLGGPVGGALTSGVFAATLQKIGSIIDKK